MRSAGNGVCAAKIPTLLTWSTFQDVYRSFHIKIPGEKACVGGAPLQMVVTVPRDA